MNENDAALIARHVEPDPYRPYPEEARLVDSGVSVWAIIGYLPTVDGDIDQAAEDYDLHPDAVRAALAYYQVHRTLIDARLAANAGGPVGSNISAA
jgi:uncharacterized protein (DUF433 family)